jgi:hypothetical protein
VRDHFKRTRPRIEPLLGLIVHRYHARRSRYRGKRKTALQAVWTAVLVNLHPIATWSSPGRSFLKWGVVGFVGLAILGALVGEDEKAGQTQKAVAATNTATASTDSTPAPTAAESSTREPTPDPKVSVSFAGPSSVRSDNVVLKGTVGPPNARVRIEGQRVKVRRGHWKLPVTLTKRGDNRFRVVATHKGYVKDSTTAVVTRSCPARRRPSFAGKRPNVAQT